MLKMKTQKASMNNADSAYLSVVRDTAIAVMAARNMPEDPEWGSSATHDSNAEGAVYAGVALANVLRREGVL